MGMDEQKKTILRRRIVTVVSVVIFLAVSALLCVYVGVPLVRSLKEEPEQFRLWVDSHGFWGRAAYVGLVVLQVVVAVIPGEIFETMGGYAFGWLEGTLLCELGIVVGSALVWLFSHFVGIRGVEAFYPKEKLEELRFLRDSKKLEALTFLLFFIPGTPKDMLTYVVGLTPMKLPTFLLITLVARFPSVITSTVGGGALGNHQYLFAVIVYAVTGLLSLAGILIYRRKFPSEKKKKEKGSDPS